MLSSVHMIAVVRLKFVCKFMCILALLFCVGIVATASVNAHTIQSTATAGPYTIEFSSFPESLEPGASTILLHVMVNNVSVQQNKPVWIKLSEGATTNLAGTYSTDNTGTVVLSYTFNGPGTYDMAVEVDGDRAVIPVHVHGQYVLMFGFLAAIFIVMFLLLDKL